MTSPQTLKKKSTKSKSNNKPFGSILPRFNYEKYSKDANLSPTMYECNLHTIEEQIKRLSCKSQPWANENLYAKKEEPKVDFFNLKGSIQELLDRTKSTPAVLSVSSPRKSTISNTFPGPGTYGHPLPNIDKKKTFGKLSIMDSKKERKSFASMGSHIGPAAFTVKFPPVHMTKDYITLSNAQRFTTRKTHVSPNRYQIRDHFSAKKNPHTVFHKADRFFFNNGCRIFLEKPTQNYKKPTDPGPAHYHYKIQSRCPLPAPKRQKMDMFCRKSLPPRIPAFNSSSRRTDKYLVQKFCVYNNPVGPGRYEPFAAKKKPTNTRIY